MAELSAHDIAAHVYGWDVQDQIDFAKEHGMVPDETGLLEFPEPVDHELMDGALHPVFGVVSVEDAQPAGEGEQREAARLATVSAEPGDGGVSTQRHAPGTFLYRWLDERGNYVMTRTTFGTYYYTAYVRSLAVWTPPPTVGSVLARTYWAPAAGGSFHWSVWRRGPRGSWAFHRFNGMVEATISQVERD